MKLAQLREEVYKCNLLLPENDLIKMTSGNVSGRDPETGWIVVKPSGLPYEQLSPDNFLIVDLDGTMIEGDLVPSIDMETHLYIYRHRPDVFGIVHTHSPFATSFGALGQPIPPVTTTCGLTGGGIPLGGYEVFGGEAIGKEVLRVIGSAYAVVMQSHGVFAVGRSASHATRVAVEVEDMAKIAHYALQRGDPIILTDEQVAFLVQEYDQKYGQKVRN
jgi:L-ribulose-5-phosphate 4-epimerase